MATADTLASAGRGFSSAVDAAVRGGERRARPHVQCRLGCTSCRIGVFDVTALDAVRLLRALPRLHRRRPDLAASAIEPDPDDVEDTLLERLHREDGTSGDTVIPAAIALEAWWPGGRRSARRATLTG